jgi:hypothetical protein
LADTTHRLPTQDNRQCSGPGWLVCDVMRGANITDSPSQIEAIQVHHLAPGHRKVAHERLQGIAAGIHLREGSELGTRPEDEVDGRTRPLELVRRSAAPRSCVFRRSVTARFGIVTAEFGSVTDHFGDVTDGRLIAQ